MAKVFVVMSGKSGHTLRLIEHLVFVKFPELEIADGVFADDPDTLAQLHEQVEAYRAELCGLSEDDLAMKAEVAETAARLADEHFSSAQEELGRFFNLPNARADFRPWAMMASWTLDQATALAFGKEPTVVTWERVREFVDDSNFARGYGQLRALLEAEPLTFPISPSEFVAWANQRDFHLPADLITALEITREEPVQSSKPSRVLLPTIKAGRPASSRGPVEEIIRELHGDDVPQRATKALRWEIGKKLKEKGLPDVDANTVRRALNSLRTAKSDRNSQN